ncbi:MAG: hypothetical protein ACE366_07985 [Bradymonadia bacterium]
MKSRYALWVLLAAFTWGCGGDDDGDTGTGNPAGESGMGGSTMGGAPETATAEAARGLTVQEQSQAAHGDGIQLGVEAAIAASVLGANGEQLVTTGTLRQEGDQLVYDASPNDRLLVVLGDNTFTYQIRVLDGDFAADTIEDFLSRAHTVDLSMSANNGTVDATLLSQNQGVDELRVIQGQFRGLDGVQYTADLRYEGRRSVDVATNSAAYEADRVLTGTITAEGFSLEARVEENYEAVLFDNYVENRARTYISRWTADGSTYTTDGVLLRTAHSNGNPTDYDFWRGEGRVLRDGNVVAELGLRQEAGRWVIFATSAEGEEIVETYPLSQ